MKLSIFNGHTLTVNGCAFSHQGEPSGLSGIQRHRARVGRPKRVFAVNSRRYGYQCIRTWACCLGCGNQPFDRGLRRYPTHHRPNQTVNGRPERLPLETFGPMPAPKRMQTQVPNAKESLGKRL